jgi:hypothetical protein
VELKNVSLEIPAKRAVAEDYLSKIDYFADFATRLLSERKHKDAEQNSNEAWGLIAARLGNKKNRTRFISKFWFADKESATHSPGERFSEISANGEIETLVEEGSGLFRERSQARSGHS